MLWDSDIALAVLTTTHVAVPVLVLLLLGVAGLGEVRHRRMARRLRELARTDELTGLPNRRAWNEELPRELARAERDGSVVTVGLVDLDLFKAFNDEHGHQAGDLVLKGLASCSHKCLRASDLMARYGGEEFAVVLPGAELDRAEEIVDRLRDAISNGLSYSAGLACWDGVESAEELVRRADSALYEAKALGRARTIKAGRNGRDGRGTNGAGGDGTRDG